MALRWNRQLLIDVRSTFDTPNGKRVLKHLKRRYSLVTNGVGTSKGVDVNTLLIMVGEANVIKYIYTLLGRDPNEEAVSHARNKTGE